MIPTLTLVIDGPDTSALTVGGIPGVGAYWFPEDGAARPSFDVEHTTADSTPGVDDATTDLLAVRRTRTSVTFTVYAQAASAAALATLKGNLEAALYQFPVELTWTENGVVTVESGWPSIPKWNDFDSGMSRAHMARATCTVPVNPA